MKRFNWQKHSSLIVTVLILFLAFSCSDGDKVSLKSLLTEMSSRENLSYFPSPSYSLKQFSSYDRRSTGRDDPGWFANADYTQFLSEERNGDRKEYVMFDADGPGAVVRWWMTFAGAGSPDGIVRVYIDNEEKPVIQDSVLKVLSGHLLAGEPLSTSVSPLTPLRQRGHNLYLPIPYSRHCKITYQCDSIKITTDTRKPSVYYNICYRTYEKGTRVRSFTADELNSNRSLTVKVNELLSALPELKGKQDGKYTSEKKISHNDQVAVLCPSGSNAITNISVSIRADNYPQALRSTVLTISFDGNNTVWVPVGEFFGSGYMRSSSRTWNSSADTAGNFESNWVMPYRRSCVVKLINYGNEDVDASLSVDCKQYEWKPLSMYFGASWHEYNNFNAEGSSSTGGTGRHCDLNFVDLGGKGVYAGDAISVFNTADAWFGEGDEKIYVDKEDFPSSIGTGTEDYYGYAWCRPEIFSHPFIAQPSGSGNFHPGLTVNLRYRDLDAIPFNNSISSNIELWHWVKTKVNYAMTSYWYVMPGYICNTEPSPMSVRNPVASKRSDVIIPEPDEKGLIEAENFELMSVSGGRVLTQSLPVIDWSNNMQLWWISGKPGDKIVLRFQIPKGGNYGIKGMFTKAADYGIISVSLNDSKSKTIFDGYYKKGVIPVAVDLGVHSLNAGDNFITVTIVGKNSSALPGYMAGIDLIWMKKI